MIIVACKMNLIHPPREQPHLAAMNEIRKGQKSSNSTSK